MNILDIAIIIYIAFGAYIGFKDGFTKSVVKCLGLFVAIIIAFILKNPISEFLMTYLPFFDFDGFVKGAPAINIIFYETIAFGLVFGLLIIVLKVLNVVTGVFEKILSATVILGMPSKVLGLVMGAIKSYTVVFVIVYIISMPALESVPFIKDSAFRKPILESTPLVSIFTKNTAKLYEEFSIIAEKHKENESAEQFNYETLELLLKYDIVKANSVEKLIERDKLHVKNADKLVEKYKEE